MKFTIIHELPGRLRVNLSMPRLSIADNSLAETSLLETQLQDVAGIKEIDFNYRTKNLLVKYDCSKHSVRDNIFKAIVGTPLTLIRKNTEKKAKTEDSLTQKKRKVFKAGGILMASPLIPLTVKPFIALYGAMPFFKKGVKSLFSGNLNVDVLDASAIGVAMGMGDYRTAGVVSFLLKVGDYLEEWTKVRSRKVLTDMFQVVDEYAWVTIDNKEKKIKATEIKEGDTVVVRTGSRIPVDGIVIDGEAMVNQSSMTGEPLPVMKRQNLTVYAGTAIEEGRLAITASEVGNKTKVAKIIKVIEESEGIKADVQSHAERLADKIVPFTFLMSGLTYALTGNPLKAASILLVDYSCAIKLSTPLAIMAGMIKAGKKGILIKGGRFIEKLAKADVFVFDKTGTLTQATPKVVDVVPFNDYDKNYILRHAACVEEHFPHPIATAVVKKAEDEGLYHQEEHSEVEYVLAHGIASKIHDKRILVGNKHFICEDEGVDTGIAEPTIESFASNGLSVLYVAIDNKLAGIIAIEDPIRNESLDFLQMLRAQGIQKIIMVTGDNEATARNVAERLKIDEFYAQVFPDKKTALIVDLKNKGYVVAMVGDGINDSPALSHADVGISMRHGADIAKEACDVLLMNGDLICIIEARKISEGVISTIKQNFKYIIGINSGLIGLGLVGLLSPAISAFMHNAVTIGVALNSLSPIGYRSNSGDGCRNVIP